MYSALKRLLLGQPLASDQEQHQRLGKPTALAVFASDAISSTAYATEEILLVLVPIAGLVALSQLMPIAIAVTIVLAVVVTSYREVIYAYPEGGGSYVVAKDNLGTMPSLVAGGSLVFDYVLTVAVSVSAGVAAITSAFPDLRSARVPICLVFIVLLSLGNLRGLKEAGRLFAVPTYVYILALASLLIWGLYQIASGSLDALPPDTEGLNELTENGDLLTGLTFFYVLRAFSSGAVALSGVEAIATGVPAFRPPESRNAARTLVSMGIILGGFFFGISILANQLKPTVSEHETLLSIMGTAVFGGDNPLYYVLQFATFAILILAANTAYSAFPVLTSIIARDGFLPRQLATRGDRLVFSNGIIVLAASAAVLVIAFQGQTTLLIPLYAVGVFTDFTLSQVGMVRRHLRLRQPSWQRSVAINAVGATATFVVLAVVVISKFAIGAWIPAVAIPAIVVVFRVIGRHYDQVNEALAIPEGWQPPFRTHTVIVPVGRMNRGVLRALEYARSLAPDRVIAVSVVQNEDEQERLMQDWAAYEIPIELQTVYSPYREITDKILEFIDRVDSEGTDDQVTVVLPEFVVAHWWENALHNQSALALKARLLYRRNTVVTSVPFHLD